MHVQSDFFKMNYVWFSRLSNDSNVCMMSYVIVCVWEIILIAFIKY
jgi:hypothetical protein